MSASPFIPKSSSVNELVIKPSHQSERDRRSDHQGPEKKDSYFLDSIRKEQKNSSRVESEKRLESAQASQNQKTPVNGGQTEEQPNRLTGPETTQPQIECGTCPEARNEPEQNTVPAISAASTELTDTSLSIAAVDSESTPVDVDMTGLNIEPQVAEDATGDKPPVGLILIPVEKLEPAQTELPRLQLGTAEEKSNLPNDDLAQLLSVGISVQEVTGPVPSTELQLPQIPTDVIDEVAQFVETAGAESDEPVILPFVGFTEPHQVPRDGDQSESDVNTSGQQESSEVLASESIRTDQFVSLETAGSLQEQTASKHAADKTEPRIPVQADQSSSLDLDLAAQVSDPNTAPTETKAAELAAQPINPETAKAAQTGDKTQPLELKVNSADPTVADNPHTARAVAVEKTESTQRSEVPPQVAKMVDQVTAAISKAAGSNQTLKIRLHPPELGVLQIEIVQTENGLTARLETDTLSTQKLLKEHMAALRESLQQQGHSIEKIDVQMQQRSAGDDQQKQQGSQFTEQDSQREKQTSQNSDRESFRQQAEQASEDLSGVSSTAASDSDELNIHV